MRKRLLVPILTVALLVNLCGVQAKGINLEDDVHEPQYISGVYKYQVQKDEESILITDLAEKVTEERMILPKELDGYKAVGVSNYFNDTNYNMDGVKYLEIPDTYIGIGYSAFESTDLKKVVIGKNVKQIGGWAFHGCRELETVVFKGKQLDLKIGQSAFSYSGLKEIKIPEGVKKINEFTFESCEKLEKCVLPSTVTYLGAHAFYFCEKLKEIDLSNIRVLGDNSFANCNSLKKVVIPGSVRKQSKDIGASYYYEGGSSADIGGRAFRQCLNLKTVIIKQGARTIGDEAFARCRSLRSITLPKSIRKIGKDAIPRNGGKTVIKGYKGSYTEKYAKKHNIKFKAI